MIRPATRADAGAVLALWERARSLEASVPDDQEAVEAAVEHGALLVAEVAGEVVGTVIAAWDGWRGNIYRLAVAPEHRRRGLGLALVEAAEARLRAVGAPRVTALVAREEADAVALWRAAGYGDDAAISRYVKNL